MRLQELCDGIVDDVDGALGCAVVDLDTGLPLASGIAPEGGLSSASIEAISAAGADCFRGKAARRLAEAMSTESESNFVEELQTTTEDTYHFMSVVPGWENALIVLITDKSANLGLGWIAMREAMDRVRKEDGVGESGGVLPQGREPAARRQDVATFNTSWRGGRGHRRSPR
ncbi:MAG: hypothetical protein OXH52_10435 [Gammaproteobacteria bacterium]|nr:hypothetical protein [Gammaproteobacteria bacterium]